MPRNRVTIRLAGSLFPLAFAAMFGTGCSDPTSLRAVDPTLTSVITVYALTGTPSAFPTAISVPGAQAVRADGNLFFDVAFDIEEDGEVVLYPMRLIAWPRLEVHSVGLIESETPFTDIMRAPESGFTYDELLVAEEGDVIIIESNDARVCAYPFPARRYAKILLEDVDPVARSIRIRMTNNPNCGFRSFLPGIPEN